MPSQRLKKFLDENNADYEVIPHELAFKAVDVAKMGNVAAREMAKPVIVMIKDSPAMIVVPASYKVNLVNLSQVFEAEVSLIPETQFGRLFPDCEIGAMPPFGHLYDMPVYVTESLSEDEDIAFNAGSHVELIRMPYSEFESLVNPGMVVLDN